MTSLPSPHANSDASRVQADRQLDSLLEAWMTPPEGLAQRICDRCRDDAGEEAFLRPAVYPRRRNWGQVILSLAACLCLLASLTVLLRERPQVAGEREAVSVMAAAPALGSVPRAFSQEAPVPAASPRVASLPAPAAVPASQEAAPRVASSHSLREQGFSFQDDLSLRRRRLVSPPQNVTAVSAQGGFPEGELASHVSPLPVAEQKVTHVWLASSKFSPEKLEDFLKKNPVLARGSAVPDEQGIFTVSLLAMDTEIQYTVDVLFGELHWKLLSPDSPQPGQRENTPVTGKPIRYTMKIIPQK